jgi:hypothetical protein
VSESCSKCDKPADVYWPAFDRNLSPAPYCREHAAEAQAHTVLDGPRLLSMVTRKGPELVTV